MIQGPLQVQGVAPDIAHRLIDPPSSSKIELLSTAARNARSVEAADGLSRAERSGAADVATVFTRTSSPEAITQLETEGLRSELVRAETILQIAQEAFTAIEVIYGGMQELVRIALDEGLTKNQRIVLNDAFQELKQDITDIIDATVFDGEHLFKGGEGPDGEFVIRLSAVGVSGAPLELLIPPGSVVQRIEGFENSNLLKVEAAQVEFDGADKAMDVIRLQGDLIALHRDTLQTIFSAEVDPNQSLTDYVESFESPKYVEGLSHLIADIVLAGDKVPFEDSADRLRDILARADFSNPSSPHTQPNERSAGMSVNRERYGFLSELDSANTVLDHAQRSLSAMGTQLDNMRRLAQDILTGNNDDFAAEGQGGMLEEKRASFQILKGQLDAAHDFSASGTGDKTAIGNVGPDGEYVIQFSQAVNGGSVHEIVIPSLRTADLLPNLDDASISSPDDALAFIRLIDRATTRGGAIYDTASSVENAINMIQTERTVIDQSAPPEPVPPNLLDDTAAVLMQQLAIDVHRDQARAQVLDTEVPKLRELDSAGRMAALTPQSLDVDLIREPGASLRSAIYEAPFEHLMGQGTVNAVEPSGFMAELLRADSVLHIAGLSVEQIDLHMDYLRGLAEEASSASSRSRLALDEVFQVVKSNIIDTLAQTAESQGERILSGGDGPDGEYVLRLSEGIKGGQSLEIAIPSMRVKDLSTDLFYADIRTPEAAVAANHAVEFASDEIAKIRDMIGEQRTLVQQLLHVERAHTA